MQKRKKKHPMLRPSRCPVLSLVGFRLTKTGRGSAVCEMRTKRQHQNMVGTVHGGILCDLSDAAMGYAFFTHLSPEQTGVTIHFQINFLHAVQSGERLRARAKTVSHKKSLYLLECDIRNASGCLMARASSICKILSR